MHNAGFYVRRIETVAHAAQNGRMPREGWTGPIATEADADREVAAWQDSGWSAEVFEDRPEVHRLMEASQHRRKVTGEAVHFAALDMLVRLQAATWLDAVRLRAAATSLRNLPALTGVTTVACSLDRVRDAQTAAYRAVLRAAAPGMVTWDEATNGMEAVEACGGLELRNLACGFPPMHRAYGPVTTAASYAAGVLRYAAHVASPEKRRAVTSTLRVVDPRSLD